MDSHTRIRSKKPLIIPSISMRLNLRNDCRILPCFFVKPARFSKVSFYWNLSNRRLKRQNASQPWHDRMATVVSLELARGSGQVGLADGGEFFAGAAGGGGGNLIGFYVCFFWDPKKNPDLHK